jgi:hypothetical protein
MTDLIVVPQTNQWQKLKTLVLDSVSSPIMKRVYNLSVVPLSSGCWSVRDTLRCKHTRGIRKV